MSPTHDPSQPWPFKTADNPDYSGYTEFRSICNAGGSDYDIYYTHIQKLPPQVIVPSHNPVKRISLIFGEDSELIVTKILEAISDRVISSIRMSKITGELYDELSLGTLNAGNRVSYLDKMVELEQAGLDIHDVLKSSGCYIQDRWMPYLLETILPDFSMLLTLPSSLEEFCDSHRWFIDKDFGSL